MASVTTDKKTGNLVVRVYGKKDPETGKPYNPSKTVSKDATDEEIAGVIEELELKAGFAKKHGKRYTVDGLLKFHLDNLELAERSATSISSFRSNVRCYITPYLGDKSYDEVTPSDFADLYRKLKKKGGKKGQGLSQVTIKKLHTFLRGAFSALSEEDIITHNVVAGLKVERGKSPEAIAMSEPDFAKLVKYLESAHDPDDEIPPAMKTAIWLVLNTGVRRGEVAGFTVKNFKPEAKEIRVECALAEANGSGSSVFYKEPKSATSKRIIALDQKTTDYLVAHLKRQYKELAANGVEQTGAAPIFAKANAAPYRPSEYTAAFRAMVKRLKLDPKLTLHKLRHTHASYLIEAGENIKTVSERLGHSTINITLGIYGHVLPGRDRGAAECFGSLSESLGKGDYNQDYYA